MRAFEQHQPRPLDVGGRLQGLGLDRALGIVLRREVVHGDVGAGGIAAGLRRDRPVARGGHVAPELRHQGIDAAAQQLPCRLRLRAVPFQKLVEQDDVGRHLADLVALRLEGAAGGVDQETEHQR